LDSQGKPVVNFAGAAVFFTQIFHFTILKQSKIFFNDKS